MIRIIMEKKKNYFKRNKKYLRCTYFLEKRMKRMNTLDNQIYLQMTGVNQTLVNGY